jgi:hypothetical protein
MAKKTRTCGNCVFCKERTGIVRTTTVCLSPSRGDSKRVRESDAACADFVPQVSNAVTAFYGYSAMAQGQPLTKPATVEPVASAETSVEELEVQAAEARARAAEARACAAEAQADAAEARLRAVRAREDEG